MSLKNYSTEQLQDLSLIELARLILTEKKQSIKFKELFERVSELKGFSEAEKDQKLSQFYTELNVDGTFMNTGSNTWGLKSWFKVQENGETQSKPRKLIKKIVRKTEDDELFDDELALIDGTIDSIEFDELDEDFDEDFDFDFSEDEEMFEEDAY